MISTRFFVSLSAIALSFCSANVLSGSKISASIKDTSINGVEGLNLSLEAPFRIQDYLVGFKYALGNLNKFPESVFARKVFDTPAEGKLSVSADYLVSDNTARMATSWSSDAYGVAVGLIGDSKNKVTHVEAQKDHAMGKNRFSIRTGYDLGRKVLSGLISCDIDNTIVDMSCSSDNVDPLLSVTRALDAQNSVTPSITVKTGKLAYAWKRNWTGGSLMTRLHPSGANKRVELEWRDEGANGVWVTNAEFPLEDSSKARVSIARDWKQ